MLVFLELVHLRHFEEVNISLIEIPNFYRMQPFIFYHNLKNVMNFTVFLHCTHPYRNYDACPGKGSKCGKAVKENYCATCNQTFNDEEIIKSLGRRQKKGDMFYDKLTTLFLL